MSHTKGLKIVFIKSLCTTSFLACFLLAHTLKKTNVLNQTGLFILYQQHVIRLSLNLLDKDSFSSFASLKQQL